MLKVMEDKSRGLTYSAVMKKEVDLCVLVPLRTADYDCLMNLYRKKGMSGDELIVLNHVQAAKNQGM